jgi:hypothetical protein
VCGQILSGGNLKPESLAKAAITSPRLRASSITVNQMMNVITQQLVVPLTISALEGMFDGAVALLANIPISH